MGWIGVVGLIFGPWEVNLRTRRSATPRSLGEWRCPLLEMRNTEEGRPGGQTSGIGSGTCEFTVPVCHLRVGSWR